MNNKYLFLALIISNFCSNIYGMVHENMQDLLQDYKNISHVENMAPENKESR